MEFLVFILLGGFAFLIGKAFEGMAIENAGKKSQKMGFEGLEEVLPNGYRIFRDVKVHEKMNCNFVVTGPAGIFVVDSKGFKGEINGTATDRTWILRKVGRRGGKYKSEVKNPLIKMRRNINTLIKYMQIEGFPIWVDGCVYFPSKETSWSGDVIRRCIITREGLAKKLTTCTLSQPLSPRQLKRINASLEKCTASEGPAMTLENFRKKYRQMERREIQRQFYESINQPLPQ